MRFRRRCIDEDNWINKPRGLKQSTILCPFAGVWDSPLMWWDLGALAVHGLGQNMVAYFLKARTIEPEEQPLLGNGCVTRDYRVTVGSGVSCEVRAEAT
jgi:hypothetical protein